MAITLKILLISALSTCLAACASLSGDWPNLAEPYPDASERERVVERAHPVEPTLSEAESPLTRSGAFKLVEATRARFDREAATYNAVKAKIATSKKDERIDTWNEAQLALTRLSHTASRLDTILISDELKSAPVWQSASMLKDQQDAFLVAERKALAMFRPKLPSQ